MAYDVTKDVPGQNSWKDPKVYDTIRSALSEGLSKSRASRRRWQCVAQKTIGRLLGGKSSSGFTLPERKNNG